MQGLHLTADLSGCDAPAWLMTDGTALAALCSEAVHGAGLRPVGELFHRFEPAADGTTGVTGVVLLAESHVAVHTWPELRAVTIDVYVCNLGRDNTERALALMARLRTAFRPASVESHQLRRGGLARSAAAAAAPAACPNVKASSNTE